MDDQAPEFAVTDEAKMSDDPEMPEDLMLVFAPVHKLAFGLAVGLTLGGVVFAVTVYAILIPSLRDVLPLLSNFFPGYRVSWGGAFIGFGWSVFAFSVAGWFCAFVRNFVLASSIWITRTRAELHAARDFLDHV